MASVSSVTPVHFYQTSMPQPHSFISAPAGRLAAAFPMRRIWDAVALIDPAVNPGVSVVSRVLPSKRCWTLRMLNDAGTRRHGGSRSRPKIDIDRLPRIQAEGRQPVTGACGQLSKQGRLPYIPGMRAFATRAPHQNHPRGQSGTDTLAFNMRSSRPDRDHPRSLVSASRVRGSWTRRARWNYPTFRSHCSSSAAGISASSLAACTRHLARR